MGTRRGAVGAGLRNVSRAGMSAKKQRELVRGAGEGGAGPMLSNQTT
jgi:hypothetical protein